MIHPPLQFLPTDDPPATPHQAIWCGPWGALLLLGNARALVAARFQGPLPDPHPWVVAEPLPAPWGGKPGLPLALSGTPLQQTVWRALSGLGAGELISYSDLAERIGRPRAVRAVASAVAANPLPILLPCHRVIRRDGRYGDYIGGAERKRHLIDCETRDRSEPACF